MITSCCRRRIDQCRFVRSLLFAVAITLPIPTIVEAADVAATPQSASASDAESQGASTHVAPSADASGNSAASSGQASENGELLEILVTAQRRSERLQDVPIAVSVLSGSESADMGITDTLSLNGRVPALTSTPHAQQTLIFLRGVGTTATGPNSESSVAMYVDGVYIYSTYASNLPLAGLDRIEVLKGPQGTLFGRNATGGVIQVITKDPQQMPEADVSLGYANYKTLTGSFYGNTPLTDNLAANLAVDFRQQYDGWGRNLLNGEKTYWNDDASVRAKLKWTPSDNTSALLTASYIENKNSGFNIQIRQGAAGSDGVVRHVPPYDTVNDGPSSYRDQAWMGALKINHDFGWGGLESITAGRSVISTLFIDIDTTPLPIFEVNGDRGPTWNVEQEIRLYAPPSSPIDWSVGGFFFRARAGLEPTPYSGLVVPLLTGNPNATQIDNFAHQFTLSKSIFAQATFTLTPSTKFTAGARQTWESVSLGGDYAAYPDGTIEVAYPNQQTSYHPLTFRFALDQKLTDNISGYASFTRGTKSGGFNLGGTTYLLPYLPEKLDSAEIGVKTEMFDDRLRFNVGGYYYWYTNVQVGQFVQGAEVVRNAASASLDGIDGDFEARLTHDLTLTGAFGFSNGHYKDYPTAVGFPASPTLPSFTFDASGKRTIFTPKFSGNLGLNYLVRTGIGTIEPNVNVAYSDSVFIQPTNRLALPSYAVVNTSATWTPTNDKFSARLWALNLFDRRYTGSFQETSIGDLQTWAPPRTYGITFSAKFQ